MDFHLSTVAFEEVFQIWQRCLWPNRSSSIFPVSTLTAKGGYNLEIKSFAEPIFLVCRINGLEVATNSVFNTDRSKLGWRSRGLFVREEYRRMGLGTALLRHSIHLAFENGANQIWSLPREAALPCYKKAGFIVKDQVSWDMEYGPNYFAEVRRS